MLMRMPDAVSTSVKALAVNWLPWSLLNMSGVPCSSAASSASTQKPLSIVADNRQLTTYRLYQSMTATR